MDYLLKSSVCLAAFYGLYFFGFRRLTFHALNRYYLLASLALSLTIPLLNYERKEVVFLAENPVSKMAFLEENTLQIPNNQIVTSNVSPEKTKSIRVDWLQVSMGIYWTGMTIMLMIFLRNIVSIIKVLALNEPKNNVFYIKSPFSNASFFNYIFINPDNLNPHEQALIIAHEACHAQRLHTLDLLLVSILKSVFWFNPIIYFYQKSLKQIHEYEVDALMSASHDSRDYAHLLLKLSVAPNSLTINHFSTKPLTERIKFLFIKPTKNMKKLLYFLSLPILAIGVMAFAEEQVVRVYQEKNTGNKNSERPTIASKEIVPKIKKEKRILGTLRKEIITQIDSTNFTYEYGFPNSKFSLANIDSLKISANNQLLVEGKDFIVKANKIFLNPKYKGSKTRLHIYSKSSGGKPLYPELTKLNMDTYSNMRFSSKIPILFAENSNKSLPEITKSASYFSKISRNQDTLRTILQANKLGKNPLVFINDEEYPSSILYRINPDAVTASSFMPPNSEKGLEKFGEKAQDGVLKLKTKKGSDFLLKNDKEYAIVAENLRKQLLSSDKRINRVILKDIKGNETEQISLQSNISGGISSFSVRLPVGQKAIFFIDGILVSEEEINKRTEALYHSTNKDKIIEERYPQEVKNADVIFNLKTKRN